MERSKQVGLRYLVAMSLLMKSLNARGTGHRRLCTILFESTGFVGALLLVGACPVSLKLQWRWIKPCKHSQQCCRQLAPYLEPNCQHSTAGHTFISAEAIER
ncbi:hypothetical protein N431DRAFT_146512 [Stipitochalara longipes BDJ]|nr:hypothetical protein N431DRAFT_146512 [Stipitochalara longipes BDJ]